MKHRKTIGLILAIIGVILIVYAVHSMHEANEAKGFVKDVQNAFSHNTFWNPLIKFFGGKAETEVSQYDTPILLTLILGIVLAIAGGVAFFSKKKS